MKNLKVETLYDIHNPCGVVTDKIIDKSKLIKILYFNSSILSLNEFYALNFTLTLGYPRNVWILYLNPILIISIPSINIDTG